MRHISHDRFYYFISQLLVGSTCLYQYLSVCLTIKCYGFNTLQYITSLVNESSWRNLNKGGEHRLTVMNQLDKMDLQGPLHKELEKIQIFKDRLIHSLLTSSQMHQVYMTGQTFLEGRGVLYGPDPSPNIWAITPRGGGNKGQTRARGPGRHRAGEQSCTLQGEPQGHGLSHLSFTGFFGHLFCCCSCMVSRKVSWRIPN